MACAEPSEYAGIEKGRMKFSALKLFRKAPSTGLKKSKCAYSEECALGKAL